MRKKGKIFEKFDKNFNLGYLSAKILQTSLKLIVINYKTSITVEYFDQNSITRILLRFVNFGN